METHKKISEYKHVHCIGIGGIGLSALARYCHSVGAIVSGSDGGTSRITEDLEKEGMIIYKGHTDANLSKDIDLIIYTIAVDESNVELRTARTRGVTCMTYPEALGLLTEEYTTIAVCGTHGKTTTTAMLASVLTACGESSTVIVGSLLGESGTNFSKGSGKYLIVEACEYKRSFLNLHPTHILVTNIDNDHLDYYKDIVDITSAFQEFVDMLPIGGKVIVHKNEYDALDAENKVLADTYVVDSTQLSVLGEHNRKNAQLVVALTDALGLDKDKVKEGLLAFRGTWRRLEYKGEYKGAKLYDDYGHHPTEIKATLQAIREQYPDGKYKLIVVFQPHLYSRTKLLMEEFSTSFTPSDKVYMLPIYASREKDDATVSSLDLVEKTDNAMYVENFEEVKKEIDTKYHSGSVVLTLGAGDVYKLHELLK